MKQSVLEKLNEKGLWQGPNDFIKDKLKFAYQLANNPSFVGVFEKRTFAKYPEFDTGNNTLYLGKPSNLFMPRVNIDKIRNSDGELKIIASQEELISTKPKGKYIKVHPMAQPIKAFPLDWTKQRDIFEPSSFDDHEVHMAGAGPLGTEIACSLMKMGLKKLKIYDYRNVEETDVSSGAFRIFDPHKPRINAAYEIIADQTMQEPEIFGSFICEFGDIVINTHQTSHARKKIWESIKNKSKLLLDVHISGLSGKLFAINPSDSESIELYEANLHLDDEEPKIITIVKLMAALSAHAFQRHISRINSLDPVYTIDLQTFFRSGK